MVPHLWYTLVTRQMLVVVMVVTKNFSPTGALRTHCWMPQLFACLALSWIMQNNFRKYTKLLPCISYSLKMTTSNLKDFSRIFNTTVAASRLFGYIVYFTISFIFIIETSPTSKRISNILFPHKSRPFWLPKSSLRWKMFFLSALHKRERQGLPSIPAPVRQAGHHWFHQPYNCKEFIHTEISA